MKPAHMALAVLVMLVWASNIVAARFAAAEVPGWALITVRMAVIAVSLVLGYLRSAIEVRAAELAPSSRP